MRRARGDRCRCAGHADRNFPVGSVILVYPQFSATRTPVDSQPFLCPVSRLFGRNRRDAASSSNRFDYWNVGFNYAQRFGSAME